MRSNCCRRCRRGTRRSPSASRPSRRPARWYAGSRQALGLQPVSRLAGGESPIGFSERSSGHLTCASRRRRSAAMTARGRWSGIGKRPVRPRSSFTSPRSGTLQGRVCLHQDRMGPWGMPGGGAVAQGFERLVGRNWPHNDLNAMRLRFNSAPDSQWSTLAAGANSVPCHPIQVCTSWNRLRTWRRRLPTQPDAHSWRRCMCAS